MLSRLFSWRSPLASPAASLYAAAVAQARRPEFYADLDVPDTVDGRFDMVALHVFLVLHRLKGQGQDADSLGQALVERMVKDMDLSLREMGTGDTGVGRRVKAMVRGLYGRIAAYGEALEAEDPRPLQAALDRNLYGTVLEVPAGCLDRMAGYLRREAAHLDGQPLEAFFAGHVSFGLPPGEESVR